MDHLAICLLLFHDGPAADDPPHLPRDPPSENAPVTRAHAPQVLEEAERALRHCPEGATFVWAYKAQALRIMGRFQESFEAWRNVPERSHTRHSTPLKQGVETGPAWSVVQDVRGCREARAERRHKH
jgi:hypothetical protein